MSRNKYLTAYSATRGAINGLTESLAEELRDVGATNVRINTFTPSEDFDAWDHDDAASEAVHRDDLKFGILNVLRDKQMNGQHMIGAPHKVVHGVGKSFATKCGASLGVCSNDIVHFAQTQGIRFILSQPSIHDNVILLVLIV